MRVFPFNGFQFNSTTSSGLVHLVVKSSIVLVQASLETVAETAIGRCCWLQLNIIIKDIGLHRWAGIFQSCTKGTSPTLLLPQYYCFVEVISETLHWYYQYSVHIKSISCLKLSICIVWNVFSWWPLFGKCASLPWKKEFQSAGNFTAETFSPVVAIDSKSG